MNRNNRVWLTCSKCGVRFSMDQAKCRTLMKKNGKLPTICRFGCDGTQRVQRF